MLDTTLNHSTEDINQIQKERGNIYGSYSDNIKTREAIIKILELHNSSNQPEGYKAFLTDVISKLVRLNNSPTHKDSIIDLKSYIDLWFKHCQSKGLL